jgi:hypothetical protein
MGQSSKMFLDLTTNRAFVSGYEEELINVTKSEEVVLTMVYVDSKKEYIYAVDDKEFIRKMKIDQKDKTEARIVFAKAKSLIGKPVYFKTRDTVDRFGNIRKWKNSNWFFDIISSEGEL